jgi:mitogen-activated protein kinase kinase kinase
MDLDLDELRDDPSEPIPLPPTLTTNFLLNDDQDQSPVSSPSSSESIPPPLTPGAPTHPHVPTLSNSPHTPAGERVLIVVTSDSEIFVTVDVSGAHDPAFIRERIFTKVS